MVDKKTDKPKAKPITKPKESKSDYFTRIATPRVKSVLKAIRILGNCSNRNNYAYEIEQIDKLSEVIYLAMNDMRAKFTKSKKAQENFEF